MKYELEQHMQFPLSRVWIIKKPPGSLWAVRREKGAYFMGRAGERTGMRGYFS